MKRLTAIFTLLGVLVLLGLMAKPARAEPIVMAVVDGVELTLTDEPCRFSELREKYPHRVRHIENRRLSFGCYALRAFELVKGAEPVKLVVAIVPGRGLFMWSDNLFEPVVTHPAKRAM